MSSTNPLMLNVKLPGRVFQLPSKGVFYEKGILGDAVKNAEIQVMPLSALAEMKLQSSDLLFTGRALREVVAECVPDILQPNLLVSKDVDALFCFLRIVTYGAEMPIKSIHNCENAKLNDYVINLENIILNANNKMLDHWKSIYKITLKNRQIVHLRPITFQDAIDVAHLRQELEKKISDEVQLTETAIIEDVMVRDLLSGISSVEVVIPSEDGDEGKIRTVVVTDTKQIIEWVKSLQRNFINEIINQSTRCNEWGFNLQVPLKCKDCGQKYSHDLELNPINFFSG